MMKSLIVALWATLVSLGAVYGMMIMQTPAPKEETKAATGPVIEAIQIKLVSVPIIADGAVQGYVLAQLTFMVNTGLYHRLPAPQDVYLTDEAFRAVYSGEHIDFHNLHKQKLNEFTRLLMESCNKRFGAPVVQDVMLTEMNYVLRSDVRGGGH